MKALRILIVEDEPLIAMDLEDLVTSVIPASVIIHASVAGALKAVEQPLDFAFLDIKVADGLTIPVAEVLSARGIPFSFLSATNVDTLPSSLRSAPFLHKPASRVAVSKALAGVAATHGSGALE
jgi:CheY-like chemotaxis protein